MRVVIFALLLATTCSVIAQSPHIFQRQDGPTFEANLHRLSLRVNESANPFVEQATIERRVVDPFDPTPDEMDARTPSMFPSVRCLWCPEEPDKKYNKNPIDYMLQMHPTEYFTRSSKASLEDLMDTCIFYTKGLDPPAPPKLSRKANDLACKYAKYTIWNLWTNANQANNNPKAMYLDHYGLYEPGHMLHLLTTEDAKRQFAADRRPVPPATIYFQNMSRAMARMCRGKIYLYTTRPKEIHIFHDKNWIMPNNQPLGPTIWASTEYVELMSHISDLAPELITIDALSTSDKPEAYKVVWKPPHDVQGTADYRRGLKVARYEPYDLDSELRNMTTASKKRALNCYDSGIDSEPIGIDFFG